MDMQQGMQQQGEEQDEEQGGFTIEIIVGADGGISVDVESASQEAGESEGGEEQNTAQPAKNIKDALAIAMDIYQNQGQVSDANAEFAAGFGGQTEKSLA